ncbi:hypothetical protein ACRW2N_24415, partial [Escherichia coli]
MKRYTHDLETDLNDVDKTPSLIHKTLLTASTIYDLKYLAQVLNDENGSNWSRAGFAPIFPDICYHLTHYRPAAADIPVASDNPVH